MSITAQVEEEQKQVTATTTILPSTQPNISKNTNNFNIVSPIDNQMLNDIGDFKKGTLEWAKCKLADEGSLLETKEVKDLVSIVDTLERSLKPKETDAPVQVNILVQNLMEAKDDC